jgi:hypothetical protein
MLWVVSVTMVVTILWFTITPTREVDCFRWVLFCGLHATVFASSFCYCFHGGTHPLVNPSS